jgi:hypothetical protein
VEANIPPATNLLTIHPQLTLAAQRYIPLWTRQLSPCPEYLPALSAAKPLIQASATLSDIFRGEKTLHKYSGSCL